MKLFFTLVFILGLLIPNVAKTQLGTKDYEIGVEIGNISFSNMGSSIDLAAKLAIVDNDELAFGPIARYKFIRHVNEFMGHQGSASFVGLGGFLHYRLMDWFYLGTEIELNQNPFRNLEPSKKWNLAGFIGGGIHKELVDDFLALNAGLMFDAVDALRDPLTTNPSNFNQYYFIQRNNPQTQQAGGGGYIPVIYRITFHFSL